MAAYTIPTIFEAIDRMSAPMQRMTSSVQNFATRTEVAIGRADRMFNKIVPSLGEIQKQLLSMVGTAAAVAGIFATGQLAAKSIMDYETALASLEAVTGESATKFKTQIENIAKSTNKSAIDVAKSFEIIGSAMSQYLSDPKALGQISEAGITLSKASRMELEPSLQALTSVMNQFGIEASKANDTINRLTAGEIVGSVSTAKISEHLQQFGGVAKANNVTLSESVALLEVFGKTLPAEQLGTASRNLITFLSSAKAMPKEARKELLKHGVSLDVLMDKHKTLGERVKELSKIQNDSVAMIKFFGRENIAAGTAIFQNIGLFNEYTKKIETTNKANEQAAINSKTLGNAFAEIKNAFVNAVVSGDKLSPTLEKLKNGAFFLANNMESVLTWTIRVIGAIIAIKTVLFLASVAMGIYNIALGVMGALSGSASIAIGASTIALNAYNFTLKVVTAAQWLWNAAMSANPIGLLIIAIAALVASVIVIIKYWDEWGAAMSVLLGPLGFVISLIQSFRKNWDMITKSFSEGGVLEGFKAIGAVILDAILYPIQQVMELIAKFTGMDFATTAANSLKNFRAELGVDVGAGETAKVPVNTAATKQESFNETVRTNNSNSTLTIKDLTGRGELKSDNPNFVMMPKLGSSFGF